MGKYRNLDQKLVYGFNNKKIPSLRQLSKLKEVLSRSEKITLIGLVVIFVFSTSFIGWRFFKSNTITLPTQGGEYTEGLIGFPVYINPILQTTDAERDIGSLVFSGLMKRDKNQILTTDLAESYKISEDQKTYTFKLREDVVWHDGDKFDADDIVFTVSSIKNAAYKSPFYLSFNSIVIKKIDNFNVEFQLTTPYTPFLNLLTIGILPEHLFSSIEPNNISLSKLNLAPIGTGAWKFDKSFFNQDGGIMSMELKRFDNYYKAKPYLDLIRFKFYPDFTTAIEAIHNKNIQGLGFVSNKDKEKVKESKIVEFKTLNLPQYTAIFFNQKNNNVLRDLNVRKALAQSINKSVIIKEAIDSEGEAIYGPILPGYIGYDQNLEKIEFELDGANKILDEAGWLKIMKNDFIAERDKDLNSLIEKLDKKIEELNNKKSKETAGSENLIALENELSEIEHQKNEYVSEKNNLSNIFTNDFYRKKGENYLHIKISTIDREENINTLKQVKSMWSKIGVNVEMETIEKSILNSEIIKTRKYEALLFGVAVGYDPDPYPFWHSSQAQHPGLNLANFANTDVDKLLEDARQISDEKIRAEKYIEFQKNITKEIPAIFLYNPTYTYPLYKKIRGVDISRISTPSDRFNNIDEWYLKTKSQFIKK
jgi:peptide/nickel transport system substrate-binding protein